MALFDVADAAARLKVIDTWKQGNPSGVLTQGSRYEPQPDGVKYDRFIRHVTAGTNSLKWLAQTGPARVSIPYLIPTKASDPDPNNWTVWKMIPDGNYTFHVGDMEWRGEQEGFWHPRSMGHEIENIANFRTPIEQRQYVKSALLYAYDCARWKWLDTMVFDHSQIAVPHTNEGSRRTDPQAGLFNEGVWWEYIWWIRDNWPWQDIARWDGGSVR